MCNVVRCTSTGAAIESVLRSVMYDWMCVCNV